MTVGAVYVAADFARADEAEAVARRCVAAGAQVVSSWHYQVEPAEAAAARTVGGPPAGQALAAATRNLREIDAADLVVVLTTGERARGGRHFETGYAHAMGKRVLLLGEMEHAFHHLPGITRIDASELENFLHGMPGS